MDHLLPLAGLANRVDTRRELIVIYSAAESILESSDNKFRGKNTVCIGILLRSMSLQRHLFAMFACIRLK